MIYRTVLAVTALALLCAPVIGQTSPTGPVQPTPPAAVPMPPATPAPPPTAAVPPPAAPAPPPPKLTTIAKYEGAGGQVQVGAFIANDQRVGVLGVSSVRRASIALAKEEWTGFLELWQQARAVKSATWQTVGTVKETGLKEPSTLTVMGGPGVQFTIADARGSFTVAVPKNELNRLDASLRKVSLFLDGATVEPDKTGASVRHHRKRKAKPPGAGAGGHRPPTAPRAAKRPAQPCTGFWCNQ
jgi:hypothetical protein